MSFFTIVRTSLTMCDVKCVNSQNGKFSYGYASSPGKRSSMEDFYETRIDGVEGEIVGLFGVFDGIYLSLRHTHTHMHACAHTGMGVNISCLASFTYTIM